MIMIMTYELFRWNSVEIGCVCYAAAVHPFIVQERWARGAHEMFIAKKFMANELFRIEMAAHKCATKYE